MSVSGRMSRMEQLHKCRRCGFSMLALRENLRATLAVIRDHLPATQAERIIEELKAIWAHT